MAQLSAAIGQQESGGRYQILGPPTKYGRAVGKYQVLPENVRSWTKEILGKEMSPQEFYYNNEAQDKVAMAKMQQYYNKTGNHASVASMWHSGRPYTGNQSYDKAAGISTRDYVQAVANKFNNMVKT